MDTLGILYSVEIPVSDFVDVPRWIESDIDTNQVAAIIQGGCASGAYMPAVTYHTAAETMAEHGDKVTKYIAENDFSVPFSYDPGNESWRGFMCRVLSGAVEVWAHMVSEEIAERIQDAEESARKLVEDNPWGSKL